MWLPICGDPDCPHKDEVKRLERENAELKRQLEKLRQQHKLYEKEHPIGTKTKRRF